MQKTNSMTPSSRCSCYEIGLRRNDFFHLCFFCGEAAKKNKYRWFKVERFGGGGLVVGGGGSRGGRVRCHKGFHVLNSARRSVTMIATHVQPIPSQSYFKRNSGESSIVFIV